MKHKRHKKFAKAYSHLDPAIRQLVDQTLSKSDEWLNSKGAHFEPLGYGDDGWWSFRVNDGYRIIAAKSDNDIILYWIDQHDDSYEWEKRHKFEKNPATSELQYYGLPDVGNETSEAHSGPFAELGSKDLLYLGVPPQLHDYVRTIGDVNNLDADFLPENAIELLTFYADLDIPRYQVFEAASAYNNSNSQTTSLGYSGCLIEVDAEAELQDALGRSMEDWRVFLHPTQLDIVTASFPGSVKVVGGAGTGKTVVAMHRAKYLAERCCAPGQKVLLTVFNTGLAAYVTEQFERLCRGDASILEKVDIDNIDNIAQRVFDLAELSGDYRRDGRDAKNKRWHNAIKNSGVKGDPKWSTDWDETFLSDEWEYVVLQNGVSSLGEYKEVKRTGRGKRLGSRERELLWQVIDTYKNDAETNGRYDNQHYIQKAADYLASLPEESERRLKYAHVIVDEVQDMSAPSLRLIRQLAGMEHPDDIMLVGDSKQRIYRYHGSLKSCGTNVPPSSSKRLYRNYRTTSQIEDFARFVLGEAWMEEALEEIDDRRSVSLLSGKEPIVETFDSVENEVMFIAKTMHELNQGGVPFETMCVVARTNDLAKKYSGLLKDQGISNARLKNEEFYPGDGLVSVSTMHHAKGLEYDVVFLAGVSAECIPLKVSGKEDEYVQEEKRDFPLDRSLLYMCITRAKQRVYITTPSELSPLLSFCCA